MDVLIDKYIMGLYQDMEDEVIADIARRVKKTGRYTETAELMAKSMVEQGYSAEKIQAEVMKMLRADKAYQMAVAENTKAYKQEIQDIINQTVKEAKEAGNELVAEAGSMAWNNDLSMWQEHGVDLKKPNSMSQLLLAFQAQTIGQLKNLTRTMGFKNTLLGTTGVLNAYQREMDHALLKVATGTFSYDQAVNDCVHRLAQSGLRSIDYESGRAYQIDTAVRMSVRTGLSQLSGKIMEENLKSSGQDLVITSQHMGSRPEHAVWQNKVFSYSGKSKKYPNFVKETGYGTVTGLKGVNCMHDFYPFWEGASIIPDDLEEPTPVKINGKEYTYYQATQQQRKMERSIRATKREIEAQKAIGGNIDELRSRLRKQTADYKKFSVDAGLRVKNNRLRVEKGSSDLTKTASYQSGNKLVRSKNRGIINSRNMANGMRQSPFVILDDEQVKIIQQYAKELEIPLEILSFNTGTQTGFVDGTKTIHIRGDIIPDKDSINNRDLLSEKAVLAHEYYGHYMNDPSQFRIGDWRDEFRASYSAAINAHGLTDIDRRMLMLDAYDRAKEAGVSVRYNKIARRIINGYDE